MKNDKKIEEILKELRLIKKLYTQNGLLDYDGFAETVLIFMDKLKRKVNKKN